MKPSFWLVKPVVVLWMVTLLLSCFLVATGLYVRAQNASEGAATALGFAKLVREHMAGKLVAANILLDSTIEEFFEAGLSEHDLAPGKVSPRAAGFMAELHAHSGKYPDFGGLLIADIQGNVRLRSSNESMASFPNGFASQVIILGQAGFAISDTILEQRVPYILVAKPVRRPDGRLVGLVATRIDLEKIFNQFYRALNLPAESIVALYGVDNRLLTGIPLPVDMIGKVPATQKLLELMESNAEEAHVFSKSAFDGLNRVYALLTVDRFPVKILVSLAETYYENSFFVYSRIVAIAILCLCTFSAVVSYFIVRRSRDKAEANALIQCAQDSLMAHVAVLNRSGVIISVNEGWRRFAEENARAAGLPVPKTDVGTNYLDVCSGAEGHCSDEANDAWAGIRQVLDGTLENYQLVYPCHSPNEQRWFQMMVARLQTEEGGVVVSHTNVTRLVLAEEALKESEQHYRTLANTGSALIWTSDLSMGCNFFNNAWLRFTGRSLESELGSGWTSGVHPDDLAKCLATYHQAFDRQKPFSMDYRLMNADGTYHWIQDDGAPRYDTRGHFLGFTGFCLDITDRKQSEQELRILHSAIEQSPDSVVITDRQGRITFVNRAFTQTTGYAPEEAIGFKPNILRSPKTAASIFVEIWKNILRGEVWSGEFNNRKKDGSEYIQSITIGPVRDEKNTINNFIAIQRDITQQRRAEMEIERLSFYDPLTGLGNRRLLLDRLAQAIEVLRKSNHVAAFLIINIDRFKTFNEANGHQIGDRLLTAFAHRIARLLKGQEVFARMSADEFALLLMEGTVDRDLAARRAKAFADQIHASLLLPLHIDDQNVIVSASIGITLIPESSGDSTHDLLAKADTVLHRVKESGGNSTAFFEQKMGDLVQHRFEVERDLRAGIAADELRLYLQPQVNAQGMLVGSEALVRWQHPEKGLLPPGYFVPVAEESDLIIDLDCWMLMALCKLLVRPELADQQIRISLNISPRHFRQPNFVASVKQQLDDFGADPSKLTLEITEGLLIEDIGDVIAKMLELSEMGIHFSLDDFGTGYSSLGYLKRLPFNELKIDKSFVQDAPDDPNDGALVETILSVAKHLNLSVVAEGVETETQAAFLNQRGTVIHQGYLFGRPEPEAVWIKRLT